MGKLRVRVPATTANLGPGFDALGLALDLWNEAEFSPRADGRIVVMVRGEGAGSLPTDDHNLVAASALRVFEQAGERPPGLQINCHNTIPLASGLGSSAAAVLSGMLAANALLDGRFDQAALLEIAIQAEGHPDNVAPALLGGLVVCMADGEHVRLHRLAPRSGRRPIFVTVVLPECDFPTQAARAVLPVQVKRQDAIFNISRAVLVAEALCGGDLGLLGSAMEDRLHQPYRLPLIPGALAAMEAARGAGAAAVALSGAGPSLAAFSAHEDPAIGQAMQRAFAAAGISARIFDLRPSDSGAEIQWVAGSR
jgi:homoserine kinase